MRTYIVDDKGARVEESHRIDSRDVGPLLISAVRYALGRRTYIVSETCTWVRRYWPSIDANSREVIGRDVEEAIASSVPGSLGGGIDADEWRRLAAWMRQGGKP